MFLNSWDNCSFLFAQSSPVWHPFLPAAVHVFTQKSSFQFAAAGKSCFFLLFSYTDHSRITQKEVPSSQKKPLSYDFLHQMAGNKVARRSFLELRRALAALVAGQRAAAGERAALRLVDRAGHVAVDDLAMLLGFLGRIRNRPSTCIIWPPVWMPRAPAVSFLKWQNATPLPAASNICGWILPWATKHWSITIPAGVMTKPASVRTDCTRASCGRKS